MGGTSELVWAGPGVATFSWVRYLSRLHVTIPAWTRFWSPTAFATRTIPSGRLDVRARGCQDTGAES
jgi:hypothetical protein